MALSTEAAFGRRLRSGDGGGDGPVGPMLRWFAFTVAVGLLPFGFSMLAQYVRQPSRTTWENSPELLFFTVMVCAAAVSELIGTLRRSGWRRRVRRSDRILAVCAVALLLAAIMAAALYGMYVYHDLASPGNKVGIDCALFAQPQRFSGTMGVSADSVRHAAAALRTECNEWMDIQTNLFRLSMWIAAITGMAATVVEWIRNRR